MEKISKTKVRKAGDIYRAFRVSSDITKEQYSDALGVISKFRSEHNSSLDAVIDSINGVLSKHKILNAMIAKRLKRSVSIESKLKRFPKMSLDRMQDIAGCRVIVANQKDLRKVKDEFRKLFKLRHNYIKHPKDDGYRSIHYTIKQDGYFVEIQLRTKIQHSWATALEIVDIFEKKSLKTKESIGDKVSKDWAEFFRLCSSVFEKYEFKQSADYDELQDMFRHYYKLKVEKKFSAYKELPPLNNNSDLISIENGYYIIIIDLLNRQAKYIPFQKSDFSNAVSEYKQYEDMFVVDDSVVVAFVSTDDLNNIKQAYPNFFADSQMFIDIVRELELFYAVEKESRGAVAAALNMLFKIIGTPPKV